MFSFALPAAATSSNHVFSSFSFPSVSITSLRTPCLSRRRAFFALPISIRFQPSDTSSLGRRRAYLDVVASSRLTIVRFPAANPSRKYITHDRLDKECPDVAKEWHPIKNSPLLPSDVKKYSGKNIWWMCSKGHEWQALVSTRSKGSMCPTCRHELAGQQAVSVLRPDLALQWHPEKNGDLRPSDISVKSTKKIWWVCENDATHVWPAAVISRSRHGCPICINRSVVNERSLATVQPDIAAEFHPTKNGDLTASQLAPSSYKKVWWQCPKDPSHEWFTSCAKRTSHRTGCPHCCSLKYPRGTLMKDVAPHLVAEFHPTLNPLDINTDTISYGSQKIVWWRCSADPLHVWPARISGRVRGMRCPYCSKKLPSATNNLETIFPNIAAEWHHKKNKDVLPSMVPPSSIRKFWFKCKDCGHVWRTSLSTRWAGHGCPDCAVRRRRRPKLAQKTQAQPAQA